MNQYIAFIRDDKGKLTEAKRIQASDMLDAIEQTSIYDVIAKLEEKEKK